ncbi:ARM repeat-containing protein [Rhizophagus irregularis]|uniref:ARM repeat-containing protein n=1 Tax=Rhizophagus irregularis TaxID=588596 RepID=A0A2N0SJR7_9GLOM|nr:ARM repeat-containing protein [Rhizophagus irregularis]
MEKMEKIYMIYSYTKGTTQLLTPVISSIADPQSPDHPSSERIDLGALQMQALNIPRKIEFFIPFHLAQCKIKALLNKLTLKKFDSISDQIIFYANNRRDGCMLREIVRLIFESHDESNFCAIYAQLCFRLMERVDHKIIAIKKFRNKFLQGGTLFKKYLLDRCEKDFKKGWKVNMMSYENYEAIKIRKQGLGLIRFIGELFKLKIIAKKTMHECIEKLLKLPEEEEMESLCILMNIVGKQLDYIESNNNEQRMEPYFERMKELSTSPNLSNQIKFLLMNVIDLRDNAWKPRESRSEIFKLNSNV